MDTYKMVMTGNEKMLMRGNEKMSKSDARNNKGAVLQGRASVGMGGEEKKQSQRFPFHTYLTEVQVKRHEESKGMGRRTTQPLLAS